MTDSSNTGARMTPGAVGAEADRLAGETYRHLRLMLVALPALMVLAILILSFIGRVEPSISDYYLGPIRDVFVGALVGTAVCLIVYRGFPPFEDYALNVAGFYAVFVAFVPTGLTETLGILQTEERQEAVYGLRGSILAVVVITIIFILVERRLGHWSVPRLLELPTSKWVFWATNALGAAFLVLVFISGFMEDSFEGIHLAAAILLFVSLAAAVASHAWPALFSETEPGENRFRKSYRTIFVLMLAGIPLALTLWALKSEYTVIALEGWEILLFSAFWVLEAKRTWSEV